MRATKSTSLLCFTKFLSSAQSPEAKELLNIVLLTKNLSKIHICVPMNLLGNNFQLKQQS